ncbi:hypothetical protein FN924_16530 [Radiobacillus deserti]|uniref:Uncharacterized protein n=1 Tax=Radiobacillus deserti TaxID=2594883 RepID=A0A516KJR2_9BACI|nr:hypothetical protein FN924_16530 [Radiobacillus deserti]
MKKNAYVQALNCTGRINGKGVVLLSQNKIEKKKGIDRAEAPKAFLGVGLFMERDELLWLRLLWIT